MLEETVYFLNLGFAEDIPIQGYFRISQAADCTFSTEYLFLTILQNPQRNNCAGVSFQPATCNFIEKEKPTFFCEFCKFFLGTTLLWKTSCELVLKGQFYKKQRTNILFIMKRSRSRQLFHGTDILRESRCLRTIARKLLLNLIVILNCFIDISIFSLLKCFVSPTIFLKKIRSSCF